jgi:hypothetical protein
MEWMMLLKFELLITDSEYIYNHLLNCFRVHVIIIFIGILYILGHLWRRGRFKEGGGNEGS